MSTEDPGAAGSDRSAPDPSVAPAGKGAAGGGTRPRGRRFSGSRPARTGRPRAGAVPADFPSAGALDAVSLTGDERRRPAGAPEVSAPRVAAPHMAGPEAGTDVPADPGSPEGGTARLGDDVPATAGGVDVVARVGPAWPLAARRPAQEDLLPVGVISGSILPGSGSRAVTPGPRVAPGPDAAAAPPLFLVDASRAALGWARRRQLGLSSACGIALALAGCAAAWFSAGTTAGTVRGVAALWASYLVLAAGRSVAARGAGPAEEMAAVRRPGSPARWLAVLGATMAEAAIYVGLAAGAAAQRWPDSWTLATAALGLVGVRNLMTACSTPYGIADPPEGLLARTCAAVVTMAAGGRVLLIGLVAPIWGARTALLALVAWAISTVCYGLASRAAPVLAAVPAGEGGARATAASPTLLRLRDDGVLARRMGTLVSGNLLPLPPAILGLAAMSALVVAGLHDLPGALMIGPAVVMLLAAPGSANPHAGRLDWLVPVLLLGSQALYVVAAGTAGRVPGPVSFALVAALVLRYADLACTRRPALLARPRRSDAAPREYGTNLGWEGRLLVTGLATALGVATAGYLVLTAYLVLLLGAKIVRSCVEPREEGHS